MGEFFKGWRRKAGLVALAMALLLTAAWMRSYVIADEIIVLHNQGGHSIMSLLGHVRWRELSSQTDDFSITWDTEETSYWLSMYEVVALIQNGVPYWSLVLPLTILSAWLIVGKPRKNPHAPNF